MGEAKNHYYDVAIGLDATWKRHIYTYHSNDDIRIGSVVQVPFGNSMKIGYVVRATTKPRVKTKSLELLTSGIVLPEKTTKLLQWLSTFYPEAAGLHVRYVLPGYVRNSNLRERKPEDQIENELKILPQSTTEQKAAIKKLLASNRPAVLHGITGSGKTRVYMELAQKSIKEGQSVLLLYPEISLTTQLQRTLAQYFPKERIHTFHSKQTPTQQRHSWEAAIGGEPAIFIGPRSGLFAPIPNLGLLVVDEAHDTAYKQDSGSRYNGLLVAAALAGFHEAKLILGSATPPVTETHMLLEKGGELVCMHALALRNSDRSVEIVDMTQRNLRSSHYLLSKKLLSEVESALSRDQQALLFLNRRGTARSVLCDSCGWHANCRQCDMPQAYHHDGFIFICHVCGTREAARQRCPDCGSVLTQKSPGTKAIEQELIKLFPQASVQRFDSDNKKLDSFTENYEAVVSGKTNIIIGTQLLTKGLDLPKLAVVGVLQADNSLLLPDYVSNERAFQQLTQVSGRVGRGHSHGKVIVQTYQPKNNLFNEVIAEDWHTFYKNEVEDRYRSGYPPHAFVMKIWTQKRTEASAERTLNRCVSTLPKNVIVLGPAPSYHTKIHGEYVWQLVLFSRSRATLAGIASKLPKELLHDLDPVSLL